MYVALEGGGGVRGLLVLSATNDDPVPFIGLVYLELTSTTRLPLDC